MNCQCQIGMLVLRVCGAAATGACSFCGCQLCVMHTMTGSGGPACPRCAATQQDYDSNEETELAKARDQHYQPYGGTANFVTRVTLLRAKARRWPQGQHFCRLL